MEMICPSGTNPDDSPLYVLCCNDTCSFTWTGAEHINQVGWSARTTALDDAEATFIRPSINDENNSKDIKCVAIQLCEKKLRFGLLAALLVLLAKATE